MQAAGEAITAAEHELGTELQRQRETWLAGATKESERVRQQCRDSLDTLRDGLQRLSDPRGLAEWLTADVIQPKPQRNRGLLSAPSSARAMANSSPALG